MTATSITIIEALKDRALLGAALGRTDSWSTWFVVLKAAFGLQLNRLERRAFASIGGSRQPPSKRVNELWAIVGRGGGKSRMAAAVAIFVAAFTQHNVDPGEIPYVLVLAASQAQASIVFHYAYAFLNKSTILRKLIKNRTASEIWLTNGVRIAVHANSFRSIRGRALVGVVFDECATWRDETSANPDLEVLRAVRPSLLRCNGQLVAISTPYRKSGLLYAKWRDHFGVDGDDVLCVQGSTSAFNPLIDEGKIAQELAADPEANRSEWLAEWRTDVSSLFDEAVIDGAVDYGRPLELPPRAGHRYHAFTDSSAGRSDAFSLCLGHSEGKREEASWVCDVIRGVSPPFDPRSVAMEYARVARQYGCSRITGDAFSGEWVAGAFTDAGIRYETSPLNRSQLYLEALPHFNRGAVSIPNHERLLRELRNLERRVQRSGRDSVDHPRAGSDDLANSLCGALYLCMNELYRPRIRWGAIDFANTGNVTWHDEDEPRQRIRVERMSEEEDLKRRGLL